MAAEDEAPDAAETPASIRGGMGDLINGAGRMEKAAPGAFSTNKAPFGNAEGGLRRLISRRNPCWRGWNN